MFYLALNKLQHFFFFKGLGVKLILLLEEWLVNKKRESIRAKHPTFQNVFCLFCKNTGSLGLIRSLTLTYMSMSILCQESAFLAQNFGVKYFKIQQRLVTPQPFIYFQSQVTTYTVSLLSCWCNTLMCSPHCNFCF